MLLLYRFLTGLGAPLINLLLWRRKLAGREDPGRLSERRGIAGAARPQGRLVWLHAASVGEAISTLPLMNALLARDAGLNLLLTTGTVSSARVLAQQLPARVTHQYVPADRTPWVRRFLAHWKPDMAIWIESELWPNLICETSARGVPMALINGRMSARSCRRWRFAPVTIRRLLSSFRVVLAHDERSAGFFRSLGAPYAVCLGDLKQAAEPLPVDEAELQRLQTAIGRRPVWIAASTHTGEEEAAGEIHGRLKAEFPSLLTIIAPRHPERSVRIAADFSDKGWRVTRRSKDELPSSGTDIYLADTMGEMGLIYRLAKIAFVGGSLVPRGGQNPLEPARLGCAILHGPHTDNFTAIYAALDAAGAARQIADAALLADAVAALLRDRQTAESRGRAAKATALTGRDKVLQHIMTAIETLLPER